MIVTYYRIHFINGSALNVCEGREDESCPGLIDRFLHAHPDGVLELGEDHMPQRFIPTNNILYISRTPADCVE